MNRMLIKEVDHDDLQILKSISKETFIETFGADNTEEDIESYLKENLTDKKLIKELSHPDSLFYVVEMDGRIVAYMKLNLNGAQTEEGYTNSLEIQRIYVLKDYKNRSIGKSLMAKAFKEAESRKLDYIWLGVWEKNTKAVSFYEKQGFVMFDKHIFKLGDDEQTDFLMKYTLNIK